MGRIIVGIAVGYWATHILKRLHEQTTIVKTVSEDGTKVSIKAKFNSANPK